MEDSMRKILYYENIIEFKESSQSPLLINEVKNWRLCYTCLKEPDPEASRICVIGSNGSYLTIMDMLKNIMDEEHAFPAFESKSFCRSCLDKITNLHFFKNQIKKAHSILDRLKSKVGENIQREYEEQSPEFVEKIVFSGQSSSSESDRSRLMEVNNEITIVEYENKSNDEMLLKEENSNDNCISVINVDGFEEFLEEQISEDADPDETVEYVVEQEMIDEIILSKEAKNDEFDDEADTDKNTKEESLDEVDNGVSKTRRSKIARLLLESNKCEICDAEFCMQRNLVQHVREQHPNSRAFKCVYCSKRFGHLQSLSRHIQNHRPDPKSICCELCGRCFKRNDDLKRHMRIHTGERPYSCTECNKSFKQHSELSSHKQTHFALKKYECEICGHVLNSRNGIYVHKKSHGVKKYKSPYCDTNAERNSHIAAHTEKNIQKNK